MGTFLAVYFLVVFAIIIVLYLIPMWKVYTRAGQPGWAVLVPIYNILIWLRIIGKPWWWVLLMMIPYVNLIWYIWATNLLVKRFGKSEGFTVGMILLPFIFWPILGYGDSKYIPLENTQE